MNQALLCEQSAQKVPIVNHEVGMLDHACVFHKSNMSGMMLSRCKEGFCVHDSRCHASFQNEKSIYLSIRSNYSSLP
jgi:hypothetical protein